MTPHTALRVIEAQMEDATGYRPFDGSPVALAFEALWTFVLTGKAKEEGNRKDAEEHA